MPFNLVVHSEAAPGANGYIVTAVGTRYARLDNNDAIKITAETPYLLWLYHGAIATGGRTVLVQPGRVNKSFQKCNLLADEDPTMGFHDFMEHPVKLKAGAKMRAQSINAADEATMIAYALSTGFVSPRGFHVDEVITGTSPTTLAAVATWEDCPIVWNEDPPAGDWSVVGMRAGTFLAANHYTAAARLVIPGHPEYRPGVLCGKNEADYEEYQSVTIEPYVWWGNVGIVFTAPESVPNVEYCSNSLDTHETVTLFLQKAGGNNRR